MRRDPHPHLPPGRAAGIQSARQQAASPMWEAMCALVGAAMVGAGIFVALGGRGPEFDRVEEAAGGAVFAAGGLLCLAGAYAMRRKRRPASAGRLPGVTLEVSSGETRRGEGVSVTLELGPGAPVQDGLEIGLICIERYDHALRTRHQGGTTRVRQIAEHAAYEHWLALDADGGPDFAFRIPPEAPYSYEGECVSYAWRLSARVARRLRPDHRVDHPIWVLP